MSEIAFRMLRRSAGGFHTENIGYKVGEITSHALRGVTLTDGRVTKDEQRNGPEAA